MIVPYIFCAIAGGFAILLIARLCNCFECRPRIDDKVERFTFQYLSPADRPVIDGLDAFEVVYAKDQPEYIPLRALRSRTREGLAMSRWSLTPEQRQIIAEGGDIFLELMTFNLPLQPIMLAVSPAPNPEYFRARYNLPATDKPEEAA